MRFGNVNLHLVSDGVYWEDGGGLFGLVPKALWERVAAPDERNRLKFEMRSLLIESAEQRILVDTGYGDKLTDKERGFISLEGERRLLDSLAKLGIGPLDVDLVINTHLHGDHCGGNTGYDENGELVPTFPWATYCVQRLELADATFPNERTQATYRRENFEPLAKAGQLRVLSGDTRLTDEVRVVVTPGHTRAHQCVVVESGGQTALFLGDLASWPIQPTTLSRWSASRPRATWPAGPLRTTCYSSLSTIPKSWPATCTPPSGPNASAWSRTDSRSWAGQRLSRYEEESS
jgi:glyoxylase-like metal-dependent hydrolase (beta-lactamase superfamily II)